MTKPHQNQQNNLVSFLRHNQPVPPPAYPNLEERIIDSLEPRKPRERKHYKTVTWTIPSAIATGFLVTTVSLGVRTPRVAIEPHDLENFLVNNWHDTLTAQQDITIDSNEVDWLLPSMTEPKPALSVSAQ
jgi:hypothetical protein